MNCESAGYDIHEVTEKPEIAICCVSPAEAVEVAGLSAELGYPVPAETIRQRLGEMMAAGDHSVLGAYVQGRLVAWIDVGIAQHLVSGTYGEIGGLIVTVTYQGCGVGKALVKAAERWFSERGVETILVRSQVKREAAHAFYLRQHFARVKTSAVFTKSLPTE